jgi:hypothetical protein
MERLESPTHYCLICDWRGVIPENAEQLTVGQGSKPVVYRWNGETHSVKRVKKVVQSTEEQHEEPI